MVALNVFTRCNLSLKPRKKRVYTYSDQYPLRSKVDYEYAVKIATSTNTVFQGNFLKIQFFKNPDFNLSSTELKFDPY